jgi:hypothetical protein
MPPKSGLFLVDVATIQADAGIGSATVGERFSARRSLDRRSTTARPISQRAFTSLARTRS